MELHDVVYVRAMPGYKLFLRFEDGVEGIADVSDVMHKGPVFEPMLDPEEFARVFVHPEAKVVTWPNGADLDTEVLYAWVTGQPIDVA